MKDIDPSEKRPAAPRRPAPRRGGAMAGGGSPPSPGIKTPVALAAALGLKLYAQRGQRAKQLAALKLISAAPGFPVRVKGLWSRAAVLEWAAAKVERLIP